MRLFDDPAVDRRFNRMQWRMLFATMIGYTLFYFMRKNFSSAMPGLEQDFGISKSTLGNFLLVGGIAYGISKWLFGIVGDKCNARKLLCFGLLSCTVVNVLFGLVPIFSGYLSTPAAQFSFLVWTMGGLFVINQLCQGAGFPPCAKLIAHWVPPKELATKMSVWNTSHSIGGGLVVIICGAIMGLGVFNVAVNEIKEPKGNDGYIELYNSASDSIDVSGYAVEIQDTNRAVVASCVLPEGSEIKADGFLGIKSDDLGGVFDGAVGAVALRKPAKEGAAMVDILRRPRDLKEKDLDTVKESNPPFGRVYDGMRQVDWLAASTREAQNQPRETKVKKKPAERVGFGMWKWCFWSMAALGAVGLVLMWLYLPGLPREEGLPDLPMTEAGGVRSSTAEAQSEPGLANRSSALRMVYLSPVIWMLGLCNFAINAARALVADWGQTMLQEEKMLSPFWAGVVNGGFEFAGIAGMLFAGWVTDRFFGGRAPRLCVFLMLLTAIFLLLFFFLPAGGVTGVLGAVALCMAGFCLYGPQALTGVTATNTSTKAFAGTSIGFISLFSYIGASVSGKVCGSLADMSGAWRVPVLVIAGVVVVGAVLFLLLWNVRANSYDSEK